MSDFIRKDDLGTFDGFLKSPAIDPGGHQPRGDQSWNPHTSYHLDGTVHLKSHDRVMLEPRRRQPNRELGTVERVDANGRMEVRWVPVERPYSWRANVVISISAMP